MGSPPPVPRPLNPTPKLEFPEAGPGEVLVSQTVKDLVVGSGIQLRDHGLAQLNGVPDEWRLYRVADSAA